MFVFNVLYVQLLFTLIGVLINGYRVLFLKLFQCLSLEPLSKTKSKKFICVVSYLICVLYVNMETRSQCDIESARDGVLKDMNSDVIILFRQIPNCQGEMDMNSEGGRRNILLFEILFQFYSNICKIKHVCNYINHIERPGSNKVDDIWEITRGILNYTKASWSLNILGLMFLMYYDICTRAEKFIDQYFISKSPLQTKRHHIYLRSEFLR